MSAAHLAVQIRGDDELGIFTRENVARDQALFLFYRASGPTLDDRFLRLDDAHYVRSAGDLHRLIQHACNPSAYIDWSELTLRALRLLKEGDEITLNYLTLYESTPNPFVCQCGSEECYGEVRGFKYLSLGQQLKIELYLSPYLRELLNKQVLSSRAQAS